MLHEPNLLACVPDLLKTQEMCNEAMPNKLHMLSHLLDHLKTKEMCDKVVNHNPWQLEYVPNHLKTQEMCNKAVGRHLCLLLEHVPDCFITQQQIKIWHDDDGTMVIKNASHKKQK